MRIFLVEDSTQIRERLVELIDAMGGHTVVGEADNFDDAVAGICRCKPDVAIFDIKLARGNGIEALAAAKHELPGLRGIVLSNYATPQHVKASAEAGAEFFLDKSAEFEKIGDILASLQNA